MLKENADEHMRRLLELHKEHGRVSVESEEERASLVNKL